MNRLSLCFIVSLLLVVKASASPVRTEVRFQPLANLIYQLDSVTEQLPGDSLDYQNLWKQEFLKTPEDQAALEAWRKLRGRYTGSVLVSVEGEFPLESPRSYISPGEKLRLASFQARSRKELLERLELVLTPADIIIADSVLQHFEGPFRTWWKREALAQGTDFSRKLSRLLKRKDISGQIEQFRTFYDARQPEGSVCSFNLMYRPVAKSGTTSGQQLDNYSVVEFLPGEQPETRLDVVVHELCHYFYSVCPPEVKAKLQQRFLSSGNPGSVPAFRLINEGLATTLGNGILARSLMEPVQYEKLLKTPLSLYNNEGIDRAGKAMIAPMDRWLQQGKTISDPAFVDLYLSALTAEFGPSLTAPRRYLSELFLFVDAPLGVPLTRQVRRTLSVGGMFSSVSPVEDARSFESYRENPNLSALCIVRPESVSALAAKLGLPESDLEVLKATVAREGRALFGFQRSPYAIGVILVTPDAEQAGKLLEVLRSMPQRFQGVVAIN